MTIESLNRGKEIQTEIEELQETLKRIRSIHIELLSDNNKGYKLIPIEWHGAAALHKEEIKIRTMVSECATNIKEDRYFEYNLIMDMYKKRLDYYTDRLEKLSKEFESL